VRVGSCSTGEKGEKWNENAVPSKITAIASEILGITSFNNSSFLLSILCRMWFTFTRIMVKQSLLYDLLGAEEKRAKGSN
jgi:hypothetical protein